jgi:predicted transcriptional regulator
MIKAAVGEQELALLRHIAEAGPMTVGQAAEGYGTRNGLARSTVLTVMERLRKKGYLTRKRTDGVFQYASRASAEELLKGVVGSFVDKSLDGSLSPFVAYLADAGEVSDDDLEQLEALVAKLQSQRKRRRG